MSTTTTTPANVAVVRSIGKGSRLTAESAPLVVAYAPEGYDWSARGAVPAVIHAWAVGAVVGSDFPIPAQKTGPKGAQSLTDYGRGVDPLAKAVRAALIPADETPDADGDESADESAPADETPATPDYLALAVQAATTATANGVDPAALLDALTSALGVTLA